MHLNGWIYLTVIHSIKPNHNHNHVILERLLHYILFSDWQMHENWAIFFNICFIIYTSVRVWNSLPLNISQKVYNSETLIVCFILRFFFNSSVVSEPLCYLLVPHWSSAYTYHNNNENLNQLKRTCRNCILRMSNEIYICYYFRRVLFIFIGCSSEVQTRWKSQWKASMSKQLSYFPRHDKYLLWGHFHELYILSYLYFFTSIKGKNKKTKHFINFLLYTKNHINYI